MLLKLSLFLRLVHTGLYNNLQWEGPREVSIPTSFSRQDHQPLGQTKLLRIWFTLILKPSMGRDCRTPLSYLFLCFTVRKSPPYTYLQKYVSSTTEILLLTISSLSFLADTETYSDPCSYLTPTCPLIPFAHSWLLTFTTPSLTPLTSSCLLRRNGPGISCSCSLISLLIKSS